MLAPGTAAAPAQGPAPAPPVPGANATPTVLSGLPSWLPSWLKPDALPFIPIPEIDTAPHSGVTIGLIPVMLSNNDHGEINQILAPDLIYSEYFGLGARYRIFRNPSDDEKWSLVAGAKQHVEREFDAEWDLGLRRDRAWSWVLHGMYDRSGTGRFYGFGNGTPASAQTTFVDAQERLELTAQRNLSREMQVSYLVRADSVEIEQSALNGLPAINARFPKLNGLGDASELHQRITWAYDNRDSIIVPRLGSRFAAFAGITTRALGSSVDYSVLGFDVTTLRPAGNDFTLVGHVAARYMPSFGNAPFWALSSLGGDRSVIGEAQPLRGYGDMRFVDRNSFAASIEARTWVQSLHLFGTDLKFEVSPFIDSGKVFASMSESPLSHLHVVGGVGLRIVALPFVVGYLDMGIGNERLAIFSGIDYPF